MRARSFLFVPASRPERFAKALDSAADCIILDLEDAVSPDQKTSARDQMAQRLRDFDRAQLARTLVRINPAGTPWHALDLRMLSELVVRGLAGAVIPKAESASDLRSAGIALGPAALLVPLIESLSGLDAVDLIARTSQVVRIAFGHLDFQLDLGMRAGAQESELGCVRFALVAASRRARLPAPIDGVTTDTSGGERLGDDLRRSRAFGFSAKLCIHPAQVQQVNESFSPSSMELDWARRVVDGARTHHGEPFALDGRMVDLPIVRLAEQTLQQAPPEMRAESNAGGPRAEL